MSVISIRLPDKLLEQLDNRAKALHVARTEYIRRAIEDMNEKTLKLERQQKLKNASLKVRTDHDPQN